MIRHSSLSQVVQPMYKSEQADPSLKPGNLKNAVLMEVLKRIEIQLLRRGILHIKNVGVFNPLWFFAEMERNVFLWRHGHSIGDHQNFEFWIDLRALIAKRRAQLGTPETENPFTNPFWGMNSPDPELVSQELAYLDDFEEQYALIETHAQALSYVGGLLIRELPGGDRIQEVVVLPEPSTTKTQVRP